MNVQERTETWGELGPAMRALPNDRWRDFVWHFCTGKPGHGLLTRSYRAAGMGRNSKPATAAKEAHKLSHDNRIIAAITEVSRKVLRVAHPEAVKALVNMVNDPEHPGHVKSVLAVIDRTDPVISRHEHQVMHRIIDPDEEALEELQALRRLGTSRDKLLELYGPNGLDRLEALEARAAARRADAAKVIDVMPVLIEATTPADGEIDAEMLGDEQ